MELKKVVALSWVPVVAASLCCLAPVIVVVGGLGTVAFASSLADTLYGDWKWAFRALGIVLLLGSVALYFRREKNVCTIDEAKKRRNEIINTTVFVLAAGVAGYAFFLYVVVHFWGVFLGLWD